MLPSENKPKRSHSFDMGDFGASQCLSYPRRISNIWTKRSLSVNGMLLQCDESEGEGEKATFDSSEWVMESTVWQRHRISSAKNEQKNNPFSEPVRWKGYELAASYGDKKDSNGCNEKTPQQWPWLCNAWFSMSILSFCSFDHKEVQRYPCQRWLCSNGAANYWSGSWETTKSIWEWDTRD